MPVDRERVKQKFHTGNVDDLIQIIVVSYDEGWAPQIPHRNDKEPIRLIQPIERGPVFWARLDLKPLRRQMISRQQQTLVENTREYPVIGARIDVRYRQCQGIRCTI
ncbi:hypothetical protein ACU8OQ_25755 (plasmid) [Rhizobium leguminosarum]